MGEYFGPVPGPQVKARNCFGFLTNQSANSLRTDFWQRDEEIMDVLDIALVRFGELEFGASASIENSQNETHLSHSQAEESITSALH